MITIPGQGRPHEQHVLLSLFVSGPHIVILVIINNCHTLTCVLFLLKATSVLLCSRRRVQWGTVCLKVWSILAIVAPFRTVYQRCFFERLHWNSFILSKPNTKYRSTLSAQFRISVAMNDVHVVHQARRYHLLYNYFNGESRIFGFIWEIPKSVTHKRSTPTVTPITVLNY